MWVHVVFFSSYARPPTAQYWRIYGHAMMKLNLNSILRIENIWRVKYHVDVTSDNHILETSGLRHLEVLALRQLHPICPRKKKAKCPTFLEHTAPAESGCVCVLETAEKYSVANAPLRLIQLFLSLSMHRLDAQLLLTVCPHQVKLDLQTICLIALVCR